MVKRKKDKHLSTKHFKKIRLSNTNPTKTGAEHRFPGKVGSSSSSIKPAVLLLYNKHDNMSW